jgi:hypothetical protein
MRMSTRRKTNSARKLRFWKKCKTKTNGNNGHEKFSI